MSVAADGEVTSEQFEYAANALRSLPFSQLIGMELVSLEADEATIKIEMRDDLRQPSGVLHGGVTATLIDTAMAFAVRTRIPREEATATIDLTVHTCAPIPKEHLPVPPAYCGPADASSPLRPTWSTPKGN
jgi:acyl-coenzyme A thioesterase PaaI-like protein